MCEPECTDGRTPAESAPDGYEPDELLLWAVACGIKPEQGWHRLIKIRNEDVIEMARSRPERYLRLKLHCALGAVITQEHLAQLLRARLAESVLKAGTVKDLAEAVRAFEKLPAATAPAAGTPGAPELDALADEIDDAGLEAAVAEARRLLCDLGGEDAE